MHDLSLQAVRLDSTTASGYCRVSPPVRGYGGRLARVEIEGEVPITAEKDEGVAEKAMRRLGWRVSVTNRPAERFPLSRVVWAYRSEYLIEREFGRLQGHPLSLAPMFQQRADAVTGRSRPLSSGLRVLTLLEFVARCLAAAGRATDWLMAKRPLAAFRGIALTIIRAPHQVRWHLTLLSRLQRHILAVLDSSSDVCTKLCANG